VYQYHPPCVHLESLFRGVNVSKLIFVDRLWPVCFGGKQKMTNILVSNIYNCCLFKNLGKIPIVLVCLKLSLNHHPDDFFLDST